MSSHPPEHRPGRAMELGELAPPSRDRSADAARAWHTGREPTDWSPLLDALQDGVLLLDGDGRVCGANHAALDLVGVDEHSLMSMRCCELAGVAERRETDCPFERLRRSGRREGTTVLLRTRRVELTVDPVVDAEGTLTGALCILRDVTEQTRAHEAALDEAALDATLADLAGELLTATSLDHAEELVLEAARFLTDSPTGAVGFLDAGESVLVVRARGTTTSVAGLGNGRHRVAELPAWCGDLIRQRCPVVRGGTLARAHQDGGPATQAGQPSRLLAVPAVSAGAVVALVAVADATRDYTERDATRIERLGVLFGLAIQRQQAARALQESEGRYRTLVENQGEGIGIVDPNESFVFANPAGERQFGVGPGGLVGRNLREFTDPRSFSRIQDQTETRKAGNRSTYEVDIVRADGARRTLLVTATPRYDSAGDFVGTFGIFRDVTERKAAEAAVRVSEARSRALYEIGQREFSTEAELVVSALEEAVRLTGSRAGYFRFVEQPAGSGELLSWSANGEEPDELAELRHVPLGRASLWAECLRTRAPVIHNEGTVPVPNGGPNVARIAQRHLCLPVRDRDQIVAVTGVIDKAKPYDETDVTQLRLFMDSLWKLIARRRAEQEHQALQQQLQVSQKMEAVGQLAGGVAHDFNNLLAAINGYADVLLEDLPELSPLREDVEQIRRAGERGAALVRQLLAFGRRQVVMPAALSVNDVVEGMTSLLRRLIGEDVSLVTRLNPAAGNVFADRGQIEQILMNLASNGRDAMPLGGTLTIATANHEVRKGDTGPHVGLDPGPYVLLSVSDTGCGMDAATKGRIFEPFYTTKPAGKGTGLGLSTVYGIVQMSGGSVAVDSAPGQGSRFEVALPRYDAIRTAWPTDLAHARPRGGAETVLLTEDEDAVRLLGSRILSAAGYRVLTAANGAEAVAVAAAEPGPIALLVVDVVMPGMSGPDLALELGAARPGLRVLFTSGYSGEAIGHHGVPDASVSFLPKPFAASELLSRVRALLDEGGKPET